jgi:hypothetical protein
MARIASQSKGGFYATPEGQLSLILPHLQVNREEDGWLNLLDPCAGEGKALQQIARYLNEYGGGVSSYGVELEKTRAEQAEEVLDVVINEGYENVRTESKFGLMWLNPPYDEVFHERTELRFLRTLTSKTRNVLIENGLLMFCVPQYVLGACSAVLASRFRDIKVYRFTDEAYPVFKQVVVFGYFGKPRTIEERKNIQSYLKETSESGPEVLPSLEEISEMFLVPKSTMVELFRAGKLRDSELADDLAHSLAFQEFEKRVTPVAKSSTMKNPLLPLKVTHAGIAVASGAIGGNMGNHIIVGVTKQVSEKQEIKDDEDLTKQEVYTKHYKSVVRVFTQDGIHELQ